MGFMDNSSRKYVKVFWPQGQDKLERDYKGIRKYYDKFTKGEYGEVDEQTFSDLSMESLYEEVDKTYSSAGEAILYNLLRKPVRDREVLNKRSEIIERFTDDEEGRIEVQKEFLNLGKNKNFDFIDFLVNDLEKDRFNKILFFILGRILPIVFFIGGFFKLEIFVLLGLLTILNAMIATKQRGIESTKPFGGIFYASKMIKVAEKILKIDVPYIDEYKEKMKSALNNIGKDKKRFKRISMNMVGGFSSIELLGPIFEAFTTMTLETENSYYALADNIGSYRDDLKTLFEVLGELDALISIAAYKENSEYETVKPEFSDDDESSFVIIEGAHPLIKNAVTNSIEIDNKGIVLTGTNMSGKSTFLRMLGINIVFAQSFNFVHAKYYKAPFLNVVSSISPDDDINEGKSYYLAEAEAILRIIKSLDKEIKVFCLIDEIFRGTNPVERIAASEEILKYIQKRNSISLVATHDRELTDFLGKTHKFYHFSEDVSESDGLSFDYKLKKGILKTRNAIKLLKYVGYPDDIIKGAYKNIEQSEEELKGDIKGL